MRVLDTTLQSDLTLDSHFQEVLTCTKSVQCGLPLIAFHEVVIIATIIGLAHLRCDCILGEECTSSTNSVKAEVLISQMKQGALRQRMTVFSRPFDRSRTKFSVV